MNHEAMRNRSVKRRGANGRVAAYFATDARDVFAASTL
jgi:hypothetical protein